MAISSAKGAVIHSSSDNSTYTVIAGVKNYDAPLSATLLDTTSFANNSGYVQRGLQGLKDFSISLDGDWDPGNAPQALLQTSLLTYATVYIKILPDGTNGFKYPCVVESFDVSAAVNGISTFKCSLKGNGAPVAVP